MSVAYRPSHADATYDMKYGVRSVQVTACVLLFNFFYVSFLGKGFYVVQRHCSAQLNLSVILLKGGGRSSARETIGRVAPGALAKKILKQYAGTEVCLHSGFANSISPKESSYFKLFLYSYDVRFVLSSHLSISLQRR